MDLDFLRDVPVLTGADARRRGAAPQEAAGALGAPLAGMVDEEELLRSASGARAEPDLDGEEVDLDDSDGDEEDEEGLVRSGHVALVGRPNVGKSSLLNAALGAKLSIVTHKAQTTRRSVLGIADTPGAQLVFVDTPGVLAREADLLDSRMNAYVKRALRDCDVAVVIVDAAEAAGVDFRKVAGIARSARDAGRGRGRGRGGGRGGRGRGRGRAGRDQVGEADDNEPRAYKLEPALAALPRIVQNIPTLLVLNKVDLLSAEQRDAVSAWHAEQAPDVRQVMLTSATTHEGVDDLLGAIAKELPLGPRYYDGEALSDQPERFFVSEIVREHIFELFDDEVPYSATVEVEQFKEVAGRKDEISLAIVVERDGQKGIMIGKGGEMIRKLNERSKRDIETFLEREIVLSLRVKVRKSWRKSDVFLRGYGYGKPGK